MKLDNSRINPANITQTFEIDPKLMNAPKTLRELVIQYRIKKNVLDKKEQGLENPETNTGF